MCPYNNSIPALNREEKHSGGEAIRAKSEVDPGAEMSKRAWPRRGNTSRQSRVMKRDLGRAYAANRE